MEECSHWSSAVGVHLMYSHHNLSTVRDLRQCAAIERHDLSRASLHGVVTTAQCLATRICSITPEAGSVLLERVLS